MLQTHLFAGFPRSVLYSVRGDSDRLFDVLDDEMNVIATLRTQDFKDTLEEQRQTQ